MIFFNQIQHFRSMRHVVNRRAKLRGDGFSEDAQPIVRVGDFQSIDKS